MPLFSHNSSYASAASGVEISFTMDDPEVQNGFIFSPIERDENILKAFDQFKIKGALFICGMKIDNPLGQLILQRWDSKGHLLANHSYSHLNFNSQDISLKIFQDDFLKVEPLMSGLKNRERLFRFPFLKEGDTVEKREQMRSFLRDQNYKQGYVTIDTSDWYINSRLREKLINNPQADLQSYRDYYLKHVWNRAIFYNNLALKGFGRKIKHTLLIHHNLLNALFLSELMEMFHHKGWTLISAKEAFKDPIFQQEPNIIPAGESIVWSAAKETGKFDSLLRYPGEDGEYIREEMDKLGL